MIKLLKRLFKKIRTYPTNSLGPAPIKRYTVNPIVRGTRTERITNTVNICTLIGAKNDTINDKYLLEDGYVKISSVIEKGIRKNTYRKGKV